MKFYFIMLLIMGQVMAHDHPSVHGMLVVGKQKVYLSHLPMFHSPHDYQAILEVELTPEALRAYRLALENSTEKVFTLVPETFVLPQMIQSPRPFKADLFAGHFERGGKKIVSQLTVKIKQVVFFKKFQPQAIRPLIGKFIVFGNEHEQFLAHEITKRPDFDQILELRASPSITEKLQDHPSFGTELGNNDVTPLSAPQIVGDFAIEEQIYLEKGDLEM